MRLCFANCNIRVIRTVYFHCDLHTHANYVTHRKIKKKNICIYVVIKVRYISFHLLYRITFQCLANFLKWHNVIIINLSLCNGFVLVQNKISMHYFELGFTSHRHKFTQLPPPVFLIYFKILMLKWTHWYVNGKILKNIINNCFDNIVNFN